MLKYSRGVTTALMIGNVGLFVDRGSLRSKRTSSYLL